MLGRLRKKNLHNWMADYGRHLVRRARAPQPCGTRHILFALCDHYEPLWGGAPEDVGTRRVQAWVERYPALGEFRDSDGRPPRHGWFFPGEEYRPQFLDGLARLVRAGFGEVEFHLHHDGDTRHTLGPRIAEHLQTFARHGHISRDARGFRWAFIHGNWSLANSRPDGRWCGVDDELVLLHELGCYVDLTFPSAPDPCQPDKVNQIYWPSGDLTRRRAYEHGERARVGAHHDDRLLMITGPLAIARKGSGLVPRIRLENGAITGDDPPTAARVATWIDQAICVDGRPEWVFVKVHTHGAIEGTSASLLGDGGRALHRALAGYMRGGTELHYVTAREMYNVARAAMDGKTGNPSAYFDHVIPAPPVAAR
ncbi:MAG TPA: hypothetical protein VF469_35310 [Kofleriaceae bacterium]